MACITASGRRSWLLAGVRGPLLAVTRGRAAARRPGSNPSVGLWHDQVHQLSGSHCLHVTSSSSTHSYQLVQLYDRSLLTRVGRRLPGACKRPDQRVRVPPTRPMSSAPPRRLHVGKVALPRLWVARDEMTRSVHTVAEENVSATLTVAAPAARVFAVLADPTTHLCDRRHRAGPRPATTRAATAIRP